ncbi:SLAP domain-containing protein [Clostridium bowmanii]|uniref:SLAP domain-containing protein n=1 Tax=Clostridium bowmanii TaxID=132925 RepID=UPI001C0E0F11|nr:SLAP domain-containing protein [Clostridium bowmanii]MBU3190275.1 SLAP domain-containing protein [Clostridium bowmanii]MCA1072513.1 SLAP domain-containing protein [Clostridium bowmanii]
MKVDGTKAKLQLYLNDGHEAAHADAKKEFYREELESLPDMNEGDININTTYVFDLGDKVEVGIYFRNGLSKEINFDKLPLMILNSKDEVVANQIFELREVGNIPPYSAVPWKLYFDKKNIFIDTIALKDGLHIVFDTNIKAYNSANIEFENVPNDSEFKKLHKYLNEMLPITSGDVNVSLYKILSGESGELKISIIVRNASDKKIKVEKIPVTIKNIDNAKIVAVGTFDTSNIEINSLKAKFFNLEFKAEQLLEKGCNIDNLAIYFNE